MFLLARRCIDVIGGGWFAHLSDTDFPNLYINLGGCATIADAVKASYIPSENM